MAKQPAMIISDSGITVVFEDGVPHNAYSSHPKYKHIKVAAKQGDWDRFLALVAPAAALEQRFGNDRVSIANGVVALDGKDLHNSLTNRMLEMLNDGFDIEPMARFLVNLHKNPSKDSVRELYGFLEASNLPITDDGHFLAYRRIKDDWTDCHSGTMDNSIGTVVKMKRKHCDDNRHNTCSTGLHFCARSYLGSFGSWNDNYRTVIVKINPKHVVSIPNDYGNAKGRCHKFTVMSEITEDDRVEGNYTPEHGFDEPELPEDVAAATKHAPGTQMDIEDNDAPVDVEDVEVAPWPKGVISFGKSRTAAREYVNAHEGTKFKDFGGLAPKGHRWGVIKK